MSLLLRESLLRPGLAWREVWQSVRRRRVAQPLFVRPGEAWSYAPQQPHLPLRHDSASAWCAAHPQHNVRIVVSGHATHDVVVQDPSLPLHDAVAVTDWAVHQFVHYHGTAAQHWTVAPWDAGGRRGATALHGIDLATLREAAHRHQVQLRAVQSWWAVGLAAVMRDFPTLETASQLQLLMVEGSLVTRVFCRSGAVLDVEQRWLEEPRVRSLHQLLQELAPSDALADASLVLGYGLADAGAAAAAALPVRALGALDGACPAYEWVCA